jgi:hypothetical protein
MSQITTQRMDDASVVHHSDRGRLSASGSHAPVHFREFVEHLVAHGRAIAARDKPGVEPPDVDWDSIWRAGDGAPSPQHAVGSIVHAAFDAARDIAGGSEALLELIGRTERRPIIGADPSHQHRGENALDLIAPPVIADHPLQSAMPLVDIPAARPETTPVAAPAEVTKVAERRDRTASPPSRGFTAFTWIRNVGVVLILFVGWQLWGTAIAQHHAQDQLRSSFDSQVHAHHDLADPTLIAADKTVPGPPEGAAVAKILVPAIGVDQIVVMGTAEADLAKGPGHYIGTAMPGQAGNVAIADQRRAIQQAWPACRRRPDISHHAVGREVHLHSCPEAVCRVTERRDGAEQFRG